MVRIVLMGLVLFWPFTAFAGYHWPVVKPVEKDFLIGDEGDQYLHFDVLGKDGRVLYQFECATPSAYGSRDLHFDYTGDFECRIWSSEDTRYPTLFDDDPNERDAWHSRARFFAYELYGPCAEYPEFGRARHFHLRGMAIDLTLKAIKFSPEMQTKNLSRRHLASFHLHVSIRPDPQARSAIAGQTNVLPPLTPDVPDQADDSAMAQACRDVRYEPDQGQKHQQSASPSGSMASFPKIGPASARLQVGLDGSQTVVIRDEAGKPTYRLSCDSEVDRFAEALVAIDCALYQIGPKPVDLLSDTVDPYSLQKRSRIDLDLSVACGGHPAWGRLRVFTLRGLRLNLDVKETRESKEHKGEFTEAVLLVKVARDEKATSPAAAQSPYIDPSFLPLDRSEACKLLEAE